MEVSTFRDTQLFDANIHGMAQYIYVKVIKKHENITKLKSPQIGGF